MFERILVPLDGSTRAARAVPVAAQIAGAVHGTIILVSVVNYFVLSQHPQRDRNNKVWANDGLSMSEAEAYLDKIACSPEIAHVTVERAILSGPIASTLLSAAASWRADMIVLTSHGRSGIMSRTLGNVSEKVVRWATIPVLVLRENGHLQLVRHVEKEREDGGDGALPPPMFSRVKNGMYKTS